MVKDVVVNEPRQIKTEVSKGRERARCLPWRSREKYRVFRDLDGPGRVAAGSFPLPRWGRSWYKAPAFSLVGGAAL
ncbi:hypothetical protein BN2364_4239 [Alloalcanivorax xenomutans]|nr:hypothetical protein BN2364_4239 [Alloalcanivorax xenomutans]